MAIIRNDSRPLYLQVKEKISNMIEEGTYREGDRLPSEAEMVKIFGVSRPTIREALSGLEEEGRLIRKHGLGTFISNRTHGLRRGIEELFSVTEAIKRMGYRSGTTGLTVEERPVEAHIAEKLKVEPGSPSITVHRIRTANEEPIVYCIDIIPVKVLKTGWKFEDFSGSILAFIEKKQGIKVDYAFTEIVPVVADDDIKGKLNVDRGTPLLLLKQNHFDTERTPVLYCENFFRGDKFTFQIVRKRC